MVFDPTARDEQPARPFNSPDKNVAGEPTDEHKSRPNDTVFTNKFPSATDGAIELAIE